MGHGQEAGGIRKRKSATAETGFKAEPRKELIKLGMSLKRFVIIVIVGFCSLGITGCWDRNEVEDISIVLGVLVDTAPDGEVSLTAQVLNPTSIVGGAGSQGGGGGDTLAWRNYKANADTLFAAGRKLAKQASPKLYFAQTQVIIISERAAQNDGLDRYIDYFERNSQFRRTNWVLISKDKEPGVLFEDPSVLERTPLKRIAEAAKGGTEVSDFAAVKLGELLNLISTEGIQPTISGIGLVPNLAHFETDVQDVMGSATEKHNLMLDGNGVFKDYKLVGWLEGTENRGYLWITDKIKGGVIEVPFGGEDGKVVLEIIRSNTKLEPIVSNDSIVINLKVNIQASIVESDLGTNYSDPRTVDALILQVKEKITGDIRDSLTKVQGEFKSDIFGFGCALNRKYPKMWREVKDRWDDEVFPTVGVELQADVVICGSGLVEKGVQFK